MLSCLSWSRLVTEDIKVLLTLSAAPLHVDALKTLQGQIGLCKASNINLIPLV